ncbi:MAG TPA: dicarboxylate/amino acid:cation symporter [Vicinamibacterales bacterium]|nr:dicarboxylate/amino acid:cation symporter [Vicinamibacterales bacterium]
MSLTTRVLIGLVAGFLLGLALAARHVPGGDAVLSTLAIAGTIFINLIRMTVLPLVAAMLVASVGSLASSGALGQAGSRAALLAVVLLVVVTLVTVLVAAPTLAAIDIDQMAAMALRPPSAPGAAGGPPTAGAPSIAQWFVDLVPPNVVKAGADGAMLPVIVFSVLFGLALAGVTADRRDSVLRGVEGIADAMQRLVAWILELAPIGVFALAAPLASKLGLAAAGAVAAYVALVVGLTIGVGIAILYPLGVVAARMPLRQFVAYCMPAQAVAFASRSSLAALPAMVESAERAGLPPVAAGFILPLAASVFRIGGAVAMPVGALFLARLYGVPVSTPQLASVVFATVLASFAVPGIPGGSIIAMVPVLAAANVPVDGIGILLAVDTIPDMFRTTENVTGSLTLAAILGRQHSADAVQITL